MVDIFLERHPEVLEQSMTTGSMVEHIIKPATEQRQCRYVDLLLEEGSQQQHVVSQGRRFYFMSHGRSRPFSELVGMLREHFSPEQQQAWRHGLPTLPWSEVFIWLDVLAMNQHRPEDIARPSLLLGLREVGEDALGTLMVLDQVGAVLTRIWCLYEAWQTSCKGKGKRIMLTYGVDIDPLRKVRHIVHVWHVAGGQA